MQTTMICYADGQMTISQQLCIKSAKEVGMIDQAYGFNPASLDRYFINRHKKILDATQRGGGKGFWLWKPYIVDQVIHALPEGDVLIYCDSGIEWITPFQHLLNRIFTESYEGQNDIFLFSNGHKHIDWCKIEVLKAMLPDSWAHQSYITQVQASVMILRVNDYTRDFCSRWLAWSCIPGFIDDSLTGSQFPEFREHRNDQSILTNLAIEDNIDLHHWPAQYWQHNKGQFPGDTYPQMFYHHRYRNIDWAKQFGYQMQTNHMLSKFMKLNKHV